MEKKTKRQDTKFRQLNSKRAKYQLFIADSTTNFIYSSNEKFEDISRDDIVKYESEAKYLPQTFISYFTTSPLLDASNQYNLSVNQNPDFIMPTVDEDQLFIKIQEVSVNLNGKKSDDTDLKEKRKRPVLDKEQKKEIES